MQKVLQTVGVNAIYSENSTATAEDAALVRPNVDTLYSRIAIDLSHNDLVLTIPKVDGERFYVFPFYDFWSNNFVNLGKLNNTVPGDYLLRYTEDYKGVGYRPAEKGSSYKGYITFPTPYALSIPRIMLYNTTSDMTNVHKIQAGIKIREVKRKDEICKDIPALTSKLLGNGVLEPLNTVEASDLNATTIPELLKVVAQLSPYNPPPPKYSKSVDAVFKSAGIHDGKYTQPKGTNATAVSNIIKLDLANTATTFESFGNQWVIWPDDASGAFEDNYAVRAYIAYYGYAQLRQYEALYPAYLSAGLVQLQPNESYIYTFPSGRPDIKGFWSLTLYNAANYLVDNPINRYALGDRSNLTYPGGKKHVYSEPNSHNPGGNAFSILLQAKAPTSSNWTNNWLPTPQNGEGFSVNSKPKLSLTFIYYMLTDFSI